MKSIAQDREYTHDVAMPEPGHDDHHVHRTIHRKVAGGGAGGQVIERVDGGSGFLEAINAGLIQRDGAGDIAPDAGALVHRAAAGSGHGLPGELRARFEQSLGTDLGGVRIHSDSAAAQASGALGARAFALGQDVYMGAGNYDPESPAGATLLAHEVAHTVQQRGASSGPQRKLEVSAPGDAMETAADTAADAMVSGQLVPAGLLAVSTGIARKIHRDTGPARQAGQQTDVVAMARELRTILETHVRELESGEARPHEERLGTAHLAETGDPGHQDGMRYQAGRLRSQITQLLSVRNDAAGLAAVEDIAGAYGIALERRTIAGPSTRSLNRVSPLDRRVVRGTETTSRFASATPHESSVDTVTVSHSRTTGYADGAISTTRDDSHRVARGDGSGTATSSSTRRSAGGHDGTWSASSGTTESQTETHRDGSSTESSSSARTSVDVSSTEASAHHTRSSSHTDTDASGNAVTRSSSGTATGGILYGEDGPGARAGFSSTTGTERRGPDGVVESNSATYSGDAQITGHGVAASGGAQSEVRRGPATVSQQINANASFHIDLAPVEGSPNEYEVVTTIRYGASGGATGRLGSESASISGGLDVNGARSSTYRHRLSHDEAEHYLESARAAARGVSSSGPPELSFMARLHAAGDHARGITDDAVLSDPSAARRLSSGSSFEQTTTVGVTAHGAVSAGGVGASGSVGQSQTRTVRVRNTRVGNRDVVEIRLTFTDGNTRTAAGHAGIEGVSIEAGTRGSGETGRVVTVQLDPTSGTYDASFQQVMAAHDLGAAEVIAQRFGAALTRSQSSSDTTNVAAGLAGEGGVGTGLYGSSQHARSSSIAYGAVDPATGRRTLEATHTGSSTQSGGLRAWGGDVLTTSSSSTAESHVANDGTQRVQIDDEDRTAIAALPQFMQDALHTTQRRLEELRFNAHDVDVLAARAHGQGWELAATNAIRLHGMSAWRILGEALRNPRPDPEWVRANANIAKQIARGAAIADFIASVDAHIGTDALLQMARGGGERLGRHIGWPESISDRGAQFHALEARVEGAAERYAALHGADRGTRIQADASEIRNGLQTILAVVQRCTTFSDTGTKVETETAIRDQITQINRAASTALGTQPASPEDEQRHRDTVLRVVQQVTTYKEEEHRHWEAAQSQIGQSQGLFANPNDCVNAATGELDAIAATYPQWVEALRAGIEASRAVHGDPDAFRHLHPNPSWSIELLRQVVRIGGTVADQIDIEARASRWRQTARIDP